MLHHISFGVSDIARSKKMYTAALGALGYRLVCSFNDFAGYGIEDNKDLFSLKLKDHVSLPPEGFHLAFAAHSRKEVDEFHKNAVNNGGRDDGKPGLRPHYGKHYYAAFIIDPDGYQIEAVYNQPE